eukprot:EG_transcript_11488
MQEALVEELKCPVCLEVFNEPVLLSCPHSVCRECASQLAATSWNASIACPLCKEATPIRNGVASLKRNVHLHNVAELLGKRTPPVASSSPTCGHCENDPALCGCQSCQTKGLARHTFTDVVISHIDTFQQAVMQPEVVCQQHKETLTLYCPVCTQLVCTMCGMFGGHRSHGCVPMAQAGDHLPPVADVEGVLQAVGLETTRLQQLLERREKEVVDDGRESEAECRRAFNACLRTITNHTRQRLMLVRQQRASIEDWQQRLEELVTNVAGTTAEAPFPERLELHRLIRALAADVPQLTVTMPPLLQLKVVPKDAPLPPPSGVTLTIALSPLPPPVAGETHRCGPPPPYGITASQPSSTAQSTSAVPEFQPDPSPSGHGLQYSNRNRRCRRADNDTLWKAAVATEGFSAGRRQFAVQVINPGANLCVGVVTADAIKTGSPFAHGVLLSHVEGKLSFPMQPFGESYAPNGCLPAGC